MSIWSKKWQLDTAAIVLCSFRDAGAHYLRQHTTWAHVSPIYENDATPSDELPKHRCLLCQPADHTSLQTTQYAFVDNRLALIMSTCSRGEICGILTRRKIQLQPCIKGIVFRQKTQSFSKVYSGISAGSIPRYVSPLLQSSRRTCARFVIEVILVVVRLPPYPLSATSEKAFPKTPAMLCSYIPTSRSVFVMWRRFLPSEKVALTDKTIR